MINEKDYLKGMEKTELTLTFEIDGKKFANGILVDLTQDEPDVKVIKELLNSARITVLNVRGYYEALQKEIESEVTPCQDFV
jgi:hypothetical protein